MGKEDRTLLSITDHDGLVETTFDGRSQESVDAVIVSFVSILMERKALIGRFLKVLMKALDDPEEFKKKLFNNIIPTMGGLEALRSQSRC